MAAPQTQSCICTRLGGPSCATNNGVPLLPDKYIFSAQFFPDRSHNPAALLFETHEPGLDRLLTAIELLQELVRNVNSPSPSHKDALEKVDDITAEIYLFKITVHRHILAQFTDGSKPFPVDDQHVRDYKQAVRVVIDLHARVERLLPLGRRYLRPAALAYLDYAAGISPDPLPAPQPAPAAEPARRERRNGFGALSRWVSRTARRRNEADIHSALGPAPAAGGNDTTNAGSGGNAVLSLAPLSSNCREFSYETAQSNYLSAVQACRVALCELDKVQEGAKQYWLALNGKLEADAQAAAAAAAN